MPSAPVVRRRRRPFFREGRSWHAEVIAGKGLILLGRVGALGAEMFGVGAVGRAYVLNTSTGAVVSTLASPNQVRWEEFGKSVAISGNTAVVGAIQEHTGGSGFVYVFDATTGSLRHTLANPTPGYDDFFGSSVAVSGNIVVVGAYGDDTVANSAGSAYVFDAGTGSLLRTLLNPTPAANDNFGFSVAVSGSTVVVDAINYKVSAESLETFGRALRRGRETCAEPGAGWAE